MAAFDFPSPYRLHSTFASDPDERKNMSSVTDIDSTDNYENVTYSSFVPPYFSASINCTNDSSEEEHEILWTVQKEQHNSQSEEEIATAARRKLYGTLFICTVLCFGLVSIGVIALLYAHKFYATASIVLVLLVLYLALIFFFVIFNDNFEY